MRQRTWSASAVRFELFVAFLVFFIRHCVSPPWNSRIIRLSGEK